MPHCILSEEGDLGEREKEMETVMCLDDKMTLRKGANLMIWVLFESLHGGRRELTLKEVHSSRHVHCGIHAHTHILSHT